MTDLGSHSLLAFAAGLLSVLSPCVLPLMPAYLSLISGISVEEIREGSEDSLMRRRVMLACFGFIIGFSAVFVLLGVGAFAAGQLVRSWEIHILGVGVGMSQLAGAVIILFGVHMTGLLPIRALYRDTRIQFRMSRYGFLSAFVIGAGFALGWSPCIVTSTPSKNVQVYNGILRSSLDPVPSNPTMVPSSTTWSSPASAAGCPASCHLRMG